MRRFVFGVTILAGAALLGGCPVYSNDRNYDCPADSYPSNGTCVPYFCGSSNDCPAGYACDPTGACSVPTGGQEAGGCGAGCPTGYVCELSARAAQCVAQGPLDAGTGRETSTVDTGAIEASADARTDAANLADGRAVFDAPDVSVAVDASDVDALPRDAASRSDVSSVVEASTANDAFDGPDGARSTDAPSTDAPSIDAAKGGASCNASAECPGVGAKCLDGTCTAELDLCSDTSQCVVAGEACVDGVCTPHCSVNAPCPAGYACDFTHGVCDLNVSPCTGQGPSTCQGATTCVEGRCVAPCAPSEAGSGCPSGQVCVHGGCLADEAAQFSCKNDGQSGLLANVCGDVDVCLHHDCYVECTPGGGACADPTAICKEVTVGEGTYAVCAPAASLGSDCDPATGKYCSGGVCIDGYCK